MICPFLAGEERWPGREGRGWKWQRRLCNTEWGHGVLTVHPAQRQLQVSQGGGRVCRRQLQRLTITATLNRPFIHQIVSIYPACVWTQTSDFKHPVVATIISWWTTWFVPERRDYNSFHFPAWRAVNTRYGWVFLKLFLQVSRRCSNINPVYHQCSTKYFMLQKYCTSTSFAKTTCCIGIINIIRVTLCPICVNYLNTSASISV